MYCKRLPVNYLIDMRAYDIFIALLIIILFGVIYFANIMAIGMTTIQKRWPEYRCNPAVMPFAGYFGQDATTNFVYCVQNMQTSYMGFLLEPVNYTMSVFSNVVGDVTSDIQSVRAKIADMVQGILGSFGSLMGAFLNIGVKIQSMVIKLKDVLAKVVGTLMTFIYLIDTGVQTGESVIRGPIGSTLNTICFLPDTPVSMEDGSTKQIKDVMVDDVLRGGTKVTGTLWLKGNKGDPDPDNALYRVRCRELRCWVYVTGTHFIYDTELEAFKRVCDHKASERTDMEVERLACLITSDHKIPIGELVFWDWEDGQ